MTKHSEQVKEYYGETYGKVHNSGAVGAYSALAHRFLESKLGSKANFSKVLEIGAGKGEHLRYVKHSFDEYVALDLNSSFEDSSIYPKVRFVQADAKEMPFPDNYFDRILNVCVLHHVSEIELVAKELRRVSADKSILTIFVPCDPGMFYRWVRHWSSHLKIARVMGIGMKETKYIWAKEHRGHYLGVKSVLEFIFSKDRIRVRRFPFPFFSWNANLFTVFEIKVNK